MKILTSEEIKSIVEEAFDRGYSSGRAYAGSSEGFFYRELQEDKQRAVAIALSKLGETL